MAGLAVVVDDAQRVLRVHHALLEVRRGELDALEFVRREPQAVADAQVVRLRARPHKAAGVASEVGDLLRHETLDQAVESFRALDLRVLGVYRVVQPLVILLDALRRDARPAGRLFGEAEGLLAAAARPRPVALDPRLRLVSLLAPLALEDARPLRAVELFEREFAVRADRALEREFARVPLVGVRTGKLAARPAPQRHAHG